MLFVGPSEPDTGNSYRAYYPVCIREKSHGDPLKREIFRVPFTLISINLYLITGMAFAFNSSDAGLLSF